MPTRKEAKQAFEAMSKDPNIYFQMSEEGKRAAWNYGKDQGYFDRTRLTPAAQVEYDKYESPWATYAPESTQSTIQDDLKVDKYAGYKGPKAPLQNNKPSVTPTKQPMPKLSPNVKRLIDDEPVQPIPQPSRPAMFGEDNRSTDPITKFLGNTAMNTLKTINSVIQAPATIGVRGKQSLEKGEGVLKGYGQGIKDALTGQNTVENAEYIENLAPKTTAELKAKYPKPYQVLSTLANFVGVDDLFAIGIAGDIAKLQKLNNMPTSTADLNKLFNKIKTNAPLTTAEQAIVKENPEIKRIIGEFGIDADGNVFKNGQLVRKLNKGGGGDIVSSEGKKFVDQYGNIKGIAETDLQLKAPVTPKKLQIPSKGKTYAIKNTALEKAKTEYDDAIETIQNYFGTNELRTIEVPRIKSELGIDIEQLVKNLEDAKPKDVRALSDIRHAQELFGLKSPISLNAKNLPKLTPSRNIERPFALSPLEQERINPPKAPRLPIAKQNDIDSINTLQKANNALNTAGQEMTTGLTGNIRTKTSGFYSTLKESPILPDNFKKVLDESEFAYGVQTNEGQLNRAATKLQTDGIESEISRLNDLKAINNGDDSMAHYLITKELTDKAIKTGDYTEVSQWLQDTRPKITNTAQALQALNQYKKATPEGMLVYANNVIEGFQKELKALNPKKFGEADTLVEKATNEIAYIENQVANDITEDLFLEEKLANRISNSLKEYTEPKNDVEANMINALFSIAKKDLPEKTKNISDPLKFVSEAISNRNQYNDIWNKAKSLLKEKYTDNPEKLSMLEDYFNARLKPVYNDSKLNKAIQNELIAKGIDLKEIVKQHYSAGSKVRQSLKETLIKTAGLTDENADYLSKKINTRMKELTKQKKESVLKQMFKPKTQKQKSILDEILKMDNLGGFKNTKYKELAYEKLGIPVLSNEETKLIIENIRKAQSMPEGTAKNILLAQIKQTIIDKNPVKIPEKIRALRNISLLGNTRTASKNILGNTSLGIMDNLSNRLGATVLKPLDRYMSKKTGVETIAQPSFKTMKEGAKKGFNAAVSDSFGGLRMADLKGKTLKENKNLLAKGFQNPIDTNVSDFNKLEMGRRLAFKNPALRAMQNAVNTSLRIGDRPFSQAYYDDIINQLKKANNTTEVTDTMKEIAEQVAKERTYQDTNAVSDLFDAVGMLPEKIQNHPKLQAVLQVFFDTLGPYMRTPANIIKRGLEYSPVGISEGLIKLSNGVKNGTLTAVEQRKIIDRLSRGIVGSTVMVGGYAAGKAGIATGPSNKDKDVSNFERNIGKIPNAVKVGNKYYDYSWLAPTSTPFSAGVQMAKSNKKGSDTLTAIGENISNAMNFYTDIPMLKMYADIVSPSMGDASFGERVLKASLELPKQLTPTMLSQIAKITDKNTRSTYDPNPVKNTLKSMQAKIPGLSKLLPAKIDTLGREILNYQGDNNIFNVMFNPGITTTEKITPAEQLVLDIYNKTGQTIQFPRVASSTYKGKSLTPKQVTELQKEMGKQTLDMLNKLAANKSFTVLDPEKQSKLIQGNLTDIYSSSKQKVLPKELLNPLK
jgi:hypothetical protein